MKISNGNTTTLQQAEQALPFIDATDRDTWIKIGMAIKSMFGDAGFDVWDCWSNGADNYSARAAVASWKSFNVSGGVNIGTLFHFAQQGGYVHNSTDKPAPPTPQQIAEREAKIKADAEAKAMLRAAAAEKAQAIWNAPPSALEATQPGVNEHPYILGARVSSRMV
ncbi:MAG: PriCT-2 domain-containing protein [Candidatus Nitrotoga sp.]